MLTVLLPYQPNNSSHMFAAFVCKSDPCSNRPPPNNVCFQNDQKRAEKGGFEIVVRAA